MRSRVIIAALLLGILAVARCHADSFDDYPSLDESFDPGLQEKLETVIADLGLGAAVERRKLSVALVDITDIENPSLASVNGDEMVYAASLPKIAILLGAFVEIERGRMTLDAATRRSLTDMIRVSSNVEATRMLNRVGKQNLIDILTSERFRLYDPSMNGGLWVGKEYGKSVAYQRDPLHHLSHGATAHQVARFYYLLETEQLMAPRLCREMKKILGNPGIRHKFVKGLEGIPGVRIFRKSGTWSNWHADSVLVEAEGHRYIAVGLAQDPDGGNWLTRLIRPLHELIVPRRIASSS